MQLSSKSKPSSIVGLEIEAGSIAATEIKGNGSIAVTKTAIAPLDPGIVSEGEVHDAPALSGELKSFFAKNKLGKTVTLGVANQRVVVRTLRMPLIEDEKELDTAVRFQAQDHIPMPLDQAVLDHQVVARENGEGGDRHMDVVAVAARRDMVNGLIAALRKAGLKPASIDLSAFGMIRALTASEPEPVEGAVRPHDPLLPSRRRHQPRRGARVRLPVHPHRALRDGEHGGPRRRERAHGQRRGARVAPRGRPGRRDR